MGFEEIEEIAIYSPQKNTLIQKMCISTNTIKERGGFWQIFIFICAPDSHYI